MGGGAAAVTRAGTLGGGPLGGGPPARFGMVGGVPGGIPAGLAPF